MIITSHPECKWCRNPHAPEELCRAARVSRRSFIFAMGAGIAGLALAGPPTFTPTATYVKLPDYHALGEAFLRGTIRVTPAVQNVGRKYNLDLRPEPTYGRIIIADAPLKD